MKPDLSVNIMIDDTYQILLASAFVWALLGFITLQFIIQAPYGQHDTWGDKVWRMDEKLGWVLMESPAPLFFFFFFFYQEAPKSAPAWILLAMWMLHYIHRAFIYPFQLRSSEATRVPVFVIALGGLYCGLNGYLNGSWIGYYGEYTNDYLTDPRFIIGCSLFACGYFLNKQSDFILIHLRKPGETQFKIPFGGGFRFVSSPNYLGEIITWLGFAIACWSLAGLSFACMTMANLVPRALAHHQWYLEQFPDYPQDRKAIIPYVL